MRIWFPRGTHVSNPVARSVAEYTKSQALTAERLGYLQVAVMQPDNFSAQLIRKTLSNLGITNTFLSKDGPGILEILGARTVDMLVAEWDAKPQNGIDLTRFLRSPDSPSRLLPVLMTTSRTEKTDMDTARDTGVNEIILKPFTMKTVLEKVTEVIDRPRAFVLTALYTGPCRRREEGEPPEGAADRRGAGGEDAEPLIISKQLLNEAFIDSRPRIIPADYSIKLKIEAAASKMAGVDNLLPEAEVAKYVEDFVQWMLTDLQNIRQSYQGMLSAPEEARSYAERVARSAQSIRGRAISSNYIFAARVSVGLSEFCRRYFNPKNPNHVMIVEKHLATLAAILNNRITGDENPVGRELVEGLKRLVYIYTLPSE